MMLLKSFTTCVTTVKLFPPEPYFAVEHNKCYCEGCACRRRDPQVKYHGTSGAQRKCAVPLGWFKCALR